MKNVEESVRQFLNGRDIYRDDEIAEVVEFFRGYFAAQALLATHQPTPTESAVAPAAMQEVGKLIIYADKEADFGFAYDISTNYDGHMQLQKLDGAKLYVLATQPTPTKGNGDTDKGEGRADS